jgi:hypothetical protein
VTQVIPLFHYSIPIFRIVEIAKTLLLAVSGTNPTAECMEDIFKK